MLKTLREIKAAAQTMELIGKCEGVDPILAYKLASTMIYLQSFIDPYTKSAIAFFKENGAVIDDAGNMTMERGSDGLKAWIELDAKLLDQELDVSDSGNHKFKLSLFDKVSGITASDMMAIMPFIDPD